jgi:hypothetical protein
MNAKNLFSMVGIIGLLFGLALVFAPNFMAEQYLTDPSWLNPGGKLMAQGWGVSLVAMGIGCWYVRNDGPTLGRKSMLLMSLVLNIGYMIVQGMAVLNGVETSLGWLQVAFSVLVVVWSGMLLRQEDRVMA